MIQRNAEGLFALHVVGATCHVLVDGDGAVVIDTGLLRGPATLQRLFADLGLAPNALRAVLLTHGHLDHVGGLAAIRAWSDAPVLAHADEQVRLDGAWPYRGWARVAGALEGLGRVLTAYRPVVINRALQNGEMLPFWGGIRVMHLPGHTAGHCGFYSPARDLLFSGDLFASFAGCTHRSPAIFTSRPELLSRSLARVRQLAPAQIYPSHYSRTLDGFALRRRFDRRFGVRRHG